MTNPTKPASGGPKKNQPGKGSAGSTAAGKGPAGSTAAGTSTARSAAARAQSKKIVNQRQTPWAAHPRVNQSLFVPEWIRALSAPQSPAEYQEAITWHYGQGGPTPTGAGCSC